MKLFNYISLYAKFIACMVKKATVTNDYAELNCFPNPGTGFALYRARRRKR